MPDEVSSGLGEFFDYVWQDTPGFVYLATLEHGERFTQYMIEWPKHREQIVRHVLAQSASGRDVYYSPSLYKEKTKPTKDNVKGSHVLWADFDGKAPSDWELAAKEKNIPQPTLIVQSSVAGNEHVYWRLNEFETSVEHIEDRNRAVAYRLGADTSGWDADQLLRPPFTANYGYRTPTEHKSWYTDKPVQVGISRLSEETVPRDSFEALGTPEREYLDKLELKEIPTVAETLALANWSPELFAVFSMNQQQATDASPGKRSAALMRLAYMGAEQGFTDEQIYCIVDDADKRWEKYTKRSPAIREKILRDTIARARAKIGYQPNEELTFAGLLGAPAVESSSVKLVYTFQEFLETEVNIEWLLTGLLAQKGIGIITGQPGVGKTQFGIQLAINLAIGSEKFLIWENQSGPKKVLFLSLEMNHPSLKLFVETMAPAYSDYHRELARNFSLAPLGETIPLDTPQGQAFVDNLMNEYKPDILFIDSFQKMTNKALSDEVASKELTAYLKRIREKYNTAIYFVHHNRKKGTDGAHIGELSDMYGSQFIAADVDFVLNMRKLGDSKVIALDSWKNRLAVEHGTMDLVRDEFLRFSPYGGSINGDGRGIAGNPIIIEPSKPRTDGEGDIFSLG